MNTDRSMKLYPRKPTAADSAFRYLGPQDLDDLQRLGMVIHAYRDTHNAALWVEKSNAWCTVHRGDWIVAEPDGDGYYPCTAAVFWRTHEVPE